MLSRTETLALLQFYVALGLDEATEAVPIDRRRLDASPPVPADIATVAPAAAPPKAVPRPAPPEAPRLVARTLDSTQAVEAAERLAATCDSLADLEAALRGFDGCALQATAMNMVFASGDPDAPVMYIGEAPGADEDRLGKPFVGPAGKLLDRMFDAIGLEREHIYFTNVVFWRPPGDRTPTPTELSVCLPFVRRHLALKRPKLVVLGGAIAAQSVLGSDLTMGRLRNKWYACPIDGAPPAIVTYHPSFLVRTPERKRDAWLDFLRLKGKLNELQIVT
jgi:uracil-DNA glycosylase family 4